MKIAYITPGSGGKFYCQNCLRDINLVSMMRQCGHEAIVVPLYLPLLDAPEIQKKSQVFYGAVNVYLDQISGLFRSFPRWFKKIFDAGFLLELIAKFASSTRASGMEELTMSMLKGREGNQSDELERLVCWLNDTFKPDVIHLSNALLLGLAPELKKRLQVPLVCSLQDEDVWVEAMEPSYVKKVYGEFAKNACFVDSFVAVSYYYKSYMMPHLGGAESKISVVYPGVPVDSYGLSIRPLDAPVIGFLSRLSDELGLGCLVDAFCTLKKQEGYKDIKLHLAGGSTSDDKACIEQVRRKLMAVGFMDDVKFFDSQDKAQRITFLESLTVLSVPIPRGEAFGLFILEANACGVPVVQPDAGAFAEVVQATGGGVVYDKGNPDGLVSVLAELLANKELLLRLGDEGRITVGREFSLDKYAEKMLTLYDALMEKNNVAN